MQGSQKVGVTAIAGCCVVDRDLTDVNRVGCDLMNLFFVYDEHSDAMDADSVRVWAGIIMDALRNPDKPRPKGEPIVGEITRT